LLGSVGEVTLSAGAIDAGADGIRVVRVHGAGQGAVLGLGSMRRRIESELDLTSLGPRKWTTIRLRAGEKDGAGTVDSGARGPGNAWTLERSAPGQPPARQTVTFQSRTDDPLGLLWLLRTTPPGPGKTETHQILDGMALWRVEVTGANSAEILAGGQTALRLDGTLAPIQFDGRPDTERPTRTFTLWMSDGPGHLPLRLEVPIGPADVVITLTQSHKLPAPPRPPAGSDRAQAAGPAPGARNL
jgi:hypothetical protein